MSITPVTRVRSLSPGIPIDPRTGTSLAQAARTSSKTAQIALLPVVIKFPQLINVGFVIGVDDLGITPKRVATSV